MRLLHTADWHIGRCLMGHPRHEDIRAAVEEIVRIARTERPGPRDEVIRVAPIPFIHANRIVQLLEDPATWMTGYADRVDKVVQALAAGLMRGYDPGRHVLLLAAHLFVTGVRFSTSERPL